MPGYGGGEVTTKESQYKGHRGGDDGRVLDLQCRSGHVTQRT